MYIEQSEFEDFNYEIDHQVDLIKMLIFKYKFILKKNEDLAFSLLATNLGTTNKNLFYYNNYYYVLCVIHVYQCSLEHMQTLIVIMNRTALFTDPFIVPFE